MLITAAASDDKFAYEFASWYPVPSEATQDAVYGTQSLAEDRLPNMKSWQAGDGLGELYIDQVLHRADLFETEVIHTPTGIDLAKSLLCGVLVLFLMLWGITASGVFARREQELGGMLYARGMGAGEQVLAELCAYLALLLLTGADAAPEEADALFAALTKLYPRTEVIRIDGGQPVHQYILVGE